MYLAPADRQLTEIGLLPVDWCAERLGNVSTCVIGLTYSPVDVADHGTLVLRSSNIQAGRLAFSDCVFVQMALPDRVITREGDLLVCVRNGSRSLIGKAALIDSSAAGSAFGAFMSVLRSNDGPYLRQVFDAASLKRQIEQGMGATINQITNRDMDALLVPWPHTAEERGSIGSVLTDTDALIDSLERLLTKKRQIKQGAMQELLTGRRRLPRFAAPERAHSHGLPKDWITAAIGDIAEVKTGPFGSALHERDYVQSGTPIITVEHLAERGIQGDGAPQVSDKDVARLQAYKIEEGDIVFSRVGSIDRNARVSADEDGWLFSGRLLRLRLKTPEIDSRFLSFLFHGERFRRQVERVAVGQTMASLNTKLLSSLEITVPVVEEQIAISDVLSAMDAEIESLESRLTKARSLKQAMAQALLTGRIRLVEPTA